MDRNSSYELNRNHQIRYFAGQATPRKLLKNINGWLKDRSVEVVSIEINSRWDEQLEVMDWSATVVYLPEGLV